jgi:hypothetical protein
VVFDMRLRDQGVIPKLGSGTRKYKLARHAALQSWRFLLSDSVTIQLNRFYRKEVSADARRHSEMVQ